jgi:4-alpha-glucanotransferase
MAFDRASGLLLHVSSLPSLGGIGDLGPASYAFADFLESAGQRIWQVLPLSPVGYGNSPYSALSAFALNPLFVSLEVLRDWGWIDDERLKNLAKPEDLSRVDFDTVIATKLPLLHEAAAGFFDKHGEDSQTREQWGRFELFCEQKADWLDAYATFVVLRKHYGGALWTNWPRPLAYREPEVLAAFCAEHAQAIVVEKLIQFACEEQWCHLRAYCGQRGIAVMGDVAIFVSFDSADVWTHPELFELDEERQPIRVAGVPPDYFSSTGQRWGNPLYRWDRLEAQGFGWWVERMRRAAELYDTVRLDHFRGFEAFWAIPAEDDTAIGGKWVKAPGQALFKRLQQELGVLPFVAEDLGVITPKVDALRTEFGMPGMRILQFGFGNRGAHIYLPHSFERNTVVYTGTHDNDTTLGWWQNGSTEEERHAVASYLGVGTDGPAWALIRSAATSVADICLFPVQDVIGAGSDARMNVPSSTNGNWNWRVQQSALTHEIAEKLRSIVDVADRTLRAKREKAEAAEEAERQALAMERAENS